MGHTLTDFIKLLERSPTSYHACREIKMYLASLGFAELREEEKWNLTPGQGYYFQRGGSVIALRTPLEKLEKMVILGSHTDSPSFKLKPNPESQSGNMLTLSTEVYGSPLFYSWFDRDLAVAGRVLVQNGDHPPEEKLIHLRDTPCLIPSPAIHLNRQVNSKGFAPNPQNHIKPIGCILDDPSDNSSFLRSLIQKQFPFDSLLAFDLFLAPLESPRFIGPEGQMLASSHLDNLSSVHASLVAFRASSPRQNTLQVAAFWDHEEVGSSSEEGAGSTLFSDFIERMGSLYDLTREEIVMVKRRSFCVSSDMTHGYHPNYADLTDSDHQCLLGKGVGIKYNASTRYATNGPSAAKIIDICLRHKLPYQPFVSKSDMPCGSTIGSIFASTHGIQTADIGVPQLAMHSTRELLATSDHLTMCDVLTKVMTEG